MLLYFVRHGQTDDNLRGIIQGQLDTPLNDHGRLEAQRVAKYLQDVPFTQALTSDLSRASETAQIIAGLHSGLEVVKVEGIRERCLGSMEGRRRLRGEVAPPDAEPGDEFRQRMTKWFQTLLSTHTPPRTISTSTSHPSKQDPAKITEQREEVILVVSHAAFISTFISVLVHIFRFNIGPEVDRGKPCLNTSIMRVKVSFREGKWRGEILSWGEVDHVGDFQRGKELRAVDHVV